jgi:hypothetical protein
MRLMIDRKRITHCRLARREGAGGAAHEDLAAFGVERDVAEGEQPAEQVAWTAQQRLQARDQFLHRKRLGEIVVGAFPQADHPVADTVARRQHQHRCGVVPAPHVAQQVEAVLVRQAEIENDRGIFHGRENVKGVADRSDRIGRKAALAQTLDQERHKLWVVFDEKHPHWCRPSLIIGCSATIPRRLRRRRVRLT